MKKDCCFTNENNWFRYRTAAIIEENGCVLFVTSKGVDYFYTVGGGVHMGEKAEDCIKREVLEETGIEYEVDHLAMVVENFFTGNFGSVDKMDCHCLEFYFVMKSRGSQELKGNSINADNEQEELHWIPIADLQKTNIKPSFLRERLPEILNTRQIIHVVTDVDRVN